uniref:UBP-type domain-containing protein n=1 Tax=Mucochytrium quahogii TaxID=96639 RepID=A0A7S2RKA6_9STRA|mmetsp:Transcript_33331/g.53816  ORF Transcript_33331/g.53816 Transcript_33331/m.53816 type:complete len:196 (+) Transcript_33331:269-856(+)
MTRSVPVLWISFLVKQPGSCCVNSCVANLQVGVVGMEGGESGYAPALHTCAHCAGAVTGVTQSFSDEVFQVGQAAAANGNAASGCLKELMCTGCNRELDEPWLCLHCHNFFGGRFACGCAARHAQDSSIEHCVSAGLSDLSFWCYECDSYLYHGTIPQLFGIYNSFHLSKFSSPNPMPFQNAEPGAVAAVSLETE